MMGDNCPKVSVIIPVYNMAEYVDRAVQSALEDDLDDIEVMAVDDGSTDGTGAILDSFADSATRRYDQRVRVIHQDNAGKSAAVNRGLERSKGEYVAFLDADDTVPPGGLAARYRKAFAGDRRADFVVGGFEVINEHGEVQGERPPPSIKDPRELGRRFYLRPTTPFHLNAGLLSRELVAEVGPFDSRLRRCIDGDYAIRVLAAADTVRTVGRAVYRYRKYRRRWRERLRYRVATARYRTTVLWKNFSAPRSLLMITFGLTMDAGKMVYELFGNFEE